MFCPNCGRELKEGEICTCQQVNTQNAAQNQSAAQYQNAAQNQNAAQYQNATQYQYGAPTNGNPYVNAPIVPKIPSKLKEMVIGFFKDPINSMKNEYKTDSVKDRMAIGYVFMGIIFLCSLLALIRPFDFADAFKYAFIFTLCIGVVKVAYAGFMYLFVKKTGADFKNVLAEVCFATLPQTALVLLLALFSLLDIYSLAMLTIGLYLVAMLVMATITLEIVFENNKKIALWVLMIFSVIIMIVLYIVGKEIVKSVVSSFVDNYVDDLLGSIWN